MNNLKSLLVEQDSWISSEGVVENNPFLLRFRPHLSDFCATRKYSVRVTIVATYSSDNPSLLPDKSTMNLFEALEDDLVKILEHDLQAVLAFVYTGINKREWHLYSKNPVETERRVNSVLANFSSLSIELLLEEDPSWSEYELVLESAE